MQAYSFVELQLFLELKSHPPCSNPLVANQPHLTECKLEICGVLILGVFHQAESKQSISEADLLSL